MKRLKVTIGGVLSTAASTTLVAWKGPQLTLSLIVNLAATVAALYCTFDAWRTASTRRQLGISPHQDHEELRRALNKRFHHAVVGIGFFLAGVLLDTFLPWIPLGPVVLLLLNETEIRPMAREAGLRDPVADEVWELPHVVYQAVTDPEGHREAALVDPRKRPLSLAPRVGGLLIAAVLAIGPVTTLLLAGQASLSSASGTGPSPTGTPGPILTASSVPLPAETQSPAAPTRPRPVCAELADVHGQLSIGDSPAAEALYRTWAEYNWPVMGCPSPPELKDGLWIVRTILPEEDGWPEIVGPTVVADRDLASASLLYPEEASVVMPLLTRVVALEARVSFGRGTIQVLRLTGDRCALAGHVFNKRSFYLAPATVAVITPELRRLGAVPFLGADETGLRVGTISVQLLAQSGPGDPRRVELGPLTVTQDPGQGTASLLGLQATDATPCPGWIDQLKDTAGKVKAAGE